MCNTSFPERTQGATGCSPAPLRPPVRNRRSADKSPRNGEEVTCIGEVCCKGDKYRIDNKFHSFHNLYQST